MLARDPLLPFELWSLANIVHVVNIIINFSPLPCSEIGINIIITIIIIMGYSFHV